MKIVMQHAYLPAEPEGPHKFTCEYIGRAQSVLNDNLSIFLYATYEWFFIALSPQGQPHVCKFVFYLKWRWGPFQFQYGIPASPHPEYESVPVWNINNVFVLLTDTRLGEQ